MIPKQSVPQKDWRFAASIGLAVGLSVPVARTVEEALVDSVGGWQAFAISLIAAAATGAIAGLVVNLVASRFFPKTEQQIGVADQQPSV
ncbi:MAG: hypothetical protein KDA52_20525 [Planctomycetaceae bacterium]|nr:hypothetical protein [Planctomycetaceae bacterium]